MRAFDAAFCKVAQNASSQAHNDHPSVAWDSSGKVFDECSIPEDPPRSEHSTYRATSANGMDGEALKPSVFKLAVPVLRGRETLAFEEGCSEEIDAAHDVSSREDD